MRNRISVGNFGPMQTDQIQQKIAASLGPAPEWIRVNDAIRLSGIGRSSLFTLIRSKRIASKVLKTNPHNVSGLRLISVESIRTYIAESGDE